MTETLHRKPFVSPEQKVSSALEEFREANVRFGNLMLQGCKVDSIDVRRTLEDADAYGAQLVQARRELSSAHPTAPMQIVEA